LVQRNTIDVKFGLFSLAFLLCSGLCYSQTYELKHLKDNQYLVKTVHRSYQGLCSQLFKNYDELQKDERGWVRTTILYLNNDTITVIETDSTELRNKILYSHGKRSKNVSWVPFIENTESPNSGEIKEE